MNQSFYQAPEGESPFTPIKNATYYRSRARSILKNFWGIAILATLIAALLGGTGEGFSFSFNFSNTEENESPLLTEENLQKLVTYIENEDMEPIAAAINEHLASFSNYLPFIIGAAIFSCLTSIALYLFVSSPVKLGYQRFQLELMDGNTPMARIPTIFLYFKEAYAKSIALNALHGLILFATSIPAIVLSCIGIFGFYNTFTAFLTSPTAFTLFDIAESALGMSGWVLLGAAISTVIRIPTTYTYTYAHMIMAEYPTIGVIDALRNSRNLMRGHKWKLFCLEISFIGWILLAALSCGIGFIFLNPYIAAARTAFYHDISNRDAAKEAEFPSLNPDDYIAQ